MAALQILLVFALNGFPQTHKHTHTHLPVFLPLLGGCVPFFLSDQLSLSLFSAAALLVWPERGTRSIPFHLQFGISFRLFRQLHCNRTDRHFFSIFGLFFPSFLQCRVGEFSWPEMETLGIWNTAKVGAHSARFEYRVDDSTRVESLGLGPLKCQYKINQLPPKRGQVLLCGAIEIFQPARCKLFDQKSVGRICTN